jgi:uncharacterized protein (DUF1697 family)
MPRYVAFLRAINVGGHVVKMDDLRRRFAQLGFTEVETFIASGNVIFSSPSRDAAALEKKIERQLEKSFGYEVKAFVRTLAEVADVAARQPFDDSRVKTAGAYCVGFLAARLPPAAAKSVLALKNGEDDFHVAGREVYWISTKRQGEAVFSNALLEKTLKMRSTFRGVRTVQKLAAKYPPE